MKIEKRGKSDNSEIQGSRDRIKDERLGDIQ